MNSVGYKIKKTILYILLILLGAACLFPFLLMVVNATRSGADIMTSFTLIPGDQLVNNWKTVFKFSTCSKVWQTVLSWLYRLPCLRHIFQP